MTDILNAFESSGIQRIRLGTFDIDGILRGKYVSRDKFESAVSSGMSFCDVLFGWDMNDDLYDRESLTGWSTGYPDALVKIDLDTFRVVPWEPNTAFFLIDMYDRDGNPYPLSPRHLFSRLVDRASKLGYTFRAAAEYEYFFFRESSHSIYEKGFRNLTPLSPGMFGYSAVRASTYSDLVHDIIESMEAFGVTIEGIHTETGPGVYESSIQYSDGVSAADRGALFKNGVKELSPRHELIPTFMAKWNADLPGCSGHIHQSLIDENGTNLFASESEPISGLANAYLAGLLELMPAMTALFCPNINSYKRAVTGVWSPVNVSWGVENRTTAVRAIPGNSTTATRLECRLPGADANPYLVMAACLAAGLHGIEKGLEAPVAVEGNAYETDGLTELPPNLSDATRLMKSTQTVREYFGDVFVEHYAMTREYEVRRYEKAVTDWELNRYFEVI
ncbi:MAG: glutamine synthetase [Gemmatimonadetes bacterium]|nr:glutamine synthetase [Gemmatimonadota bacterium]HCK12032.1 glutamine synthetase [Candidatus Latescibacterota bacterium]